MAFEYTIYTSYFFNKNTILRSKFLHIVKPFSLQERCTLCLSGFTERTILDRIENQFLEKSQICRLACHAHKSLVEIIAQALSFPGAHVVAGQNHREAFLNQGSCRVISQVIDQAQNLERKDAQQI